MKGYPVFVRGPWRACPKCNALSSFGFLMVSGRNRLVRRCTGCRFTDSEPLPAVDKRVIYLDQFALSEVYKVQSGKRRESAPHRAFWESANAAVDRVLVLQQAIFPASDIHLDETIVSKFSAELRAAYKRLSGTVSFHDSEYVLRRQLWSFADAYLGGEGPPALDFAVDGVLIGDRNAWFPDMSISVNADFSGFADDIRARREKVSDSMRGIAEGWAKDKVEFEDILKQELEDFGRSHKQALAAGVNTVVMQHEDLAAKFEAAGLDADIVSEFVFDFWDWPGLYELPVHRISAYLYAAVARKMAAGQRRPPNQGMMNDIAAISTFGPYVDAMFVDNECAALLAEEPLRSDLKLKAQIFSLNSGDAFLAYLAKLEGLASAEVCAYAKEIYGYKG